MSHRGLVGTESQGWTTQRPVTAYVLFAFAISWVLWLPIVLVGDAVWAQLLFLVGGLGPAIAAGLVTRRSGGSLRVWLAPVLRWRVPLRYWLYALGLPALLVGIMNVLFALSGEEVDLSALPGRLPAYVVTLVFVAILGGGLEELGWRGFALPLLQDRWSPLVATLIVGFVWGLWHVPLTGPLGFVEPMVLAFFYTWLYNRSGSVLLCILLHASFTPAFEHLILPEDAVTIETIGFDEVAIMGTLVAAVVVLLVGTRGRLGASRQ